MEEIKLIHRNLKIILKNLTLW